MSFSRIVPRVFFFPAVLLLMLALLAPPARAQAPDDPRPTAVAAMKTWLQEMDGGQYAQSWKDASSFFQKAITQDQWVAASKSVRMPLGKLSSRVQASAMHQTDAPSPDGTIKGDFVIAQFNASFENLAYAIETVSFEKDTDGQWRAAGYYIKPK
jgi:hypothetical protein